MILLVLTLAAALGFAGVGHLVTRYTLNQQARGRKLYEVGLTATQAGHYEQAIDAFRAALTCDPTNSQYQLSLARALRDSNDPHLLEEAESYLIALWQRTPQDAAVNLALARVAAHRGSIEDATRYYHNAMYGVWNSDPDNNRNRARVELIQFLLKKGARRKPTPNSSPYPRRCRPIPSSSSRPRTSLNRLRITTARSPATKTYFASLH